MINIVIPFFSKSGHTKRVAEAICEGVNTSTSRGCLIDISQMTDESWLTLEQAGGVIFGSPTFMGSAAGEYKLFLDETARREFWTGGKFVDKMAAGFTVATYPSGDKLNTIIQLSIYAAQHGMIWVNNTGLGCKVTNDPEEFNEWGCWLGFMATSIADKTKLISDTDVLGAKKFGLRFAKALQRWDRGV